MTFSQYSAKEFVEERILPELTDEERSILSDKPILGQIPRLDIIAKFLNERGTKWSRADFDKQYSGQPSVTKCMVRIVRNIEKRIEKYAEI